MNRENIVQLDKKVQEALLQEKDLPFDSPKETPDVPRVGYRLQHACDVEIRTDSRIVTEEAEGWYSGRLVVDQTIQAYDRPVGQTAVRQARDALTCDSYKLLRATFDMIQPLDLGPPPSSGDAFAFCERARQEGGEATQCTVIAGADDLACSVRAAAPDRGTAVNMLRRLLPTVWRSCLKVGS